MPKLDPDALSLNITMNDWLNDFFTSSWDRPTKTLFDLYSYAGQTTIPLNY